MFLEMKNITKCFDATKALDDVSFSCEKGEIRGLLGENGAGKSTLLKTMTGLLRPSGGEIRFQGHKWSRRDLTQIGALIENPPIYENLTAWENMKVKALLAGASDERIREALEEAEIADTGKKRAGAFSLGMKQRLGIALALLGNPRLLVLDEPIKSCGSYQIKAKLGYEVSGTVNVLVIEG